MVLVVLTTTAANAISGGRARIVRENQPIPCIATEEASTVIRTLAIWTSLASAVASLCFGARAMRDIGALIAPTPCHEIMTVRHSI